MAEMCKLLGKSLQKRNGDEFFQVDTDQSEGLGEKEYVGLYFSGHWCPPCRQFTPALIKFYERLKKAEPNKFEVVFVSSDRDESSFKNYTEDMPWLYLPFADRDRKNELSKNFNVAGIPTLVLLDAKTGKLITCEGRDKVNEDFRAEMFPWFPKTYEEIMKGDDVPESRKGTFVKGDYLEKLEGKVFGLYFSAHWCPPCRAFTPQLVTKYNELKNAGKPFEIIFVSMDKTEKEYIDYQKEMPWPAFPHEDPRCQSFLKEFKIEGIPALVLISADWKLITTHGREVIMESQIEDFPYTNLPVVNLVSGRFIEILQNSRYLVYFTDSANVQKSKKIMSGPANEYSDDSNKQKMSFFVGDNFDEETLSGSLYKFLMGAEKRHCLLIADTSKNTKYVADNCTMSEENIREFITKVEENKIEATPIH